jgi:PIN domain nuclease of toxin-antitoxin system
MALIKSSKMPRGRLLLDTHALLWMVFDDPRLPSSARQMIEQAEVLYYSMASLWEIAIKQGRKGFDFQLPDYWHQGLPEELGRLDLRRLNLSPEYLATFQKLPLRHSDPFDRMLIAQAQVEGLCLLSKDRQMSEYDVSVYW